MSVVTQFNTDNTAFKLEYDVTPRDLSKSVEPPNGLTSQSPSFRYRGYPEGKFESNRKPITVSDVPTQLEKLDADFTDRKYNKINLFDKEKPRAFGNDRNTFVFGSDNLPSTEVKPKRIAGALMEKSQDRESSSAQLRRFNENKSLAAQEIAGFKEKRLRELEEKRQQQEEDKALLNNYNPWNKPGAGAPLGEDHKKRVFTETDLEVRAGITPRPNPHMQELLEEHGDFHSQFGRPGHGAALRTNSGRLKTELKGATDIRFQNKKVNDIETRYKPTSPTQIIQYSEALENQIAERRLREQMERKDQMSKELETLNHNPYGRPGAGAPNATKSGGDCDQHNKPIDSKSNKHSLMLNNNNNASIATQQGHKRRSAGDVLQTERMDATAEDCANTSVRVNGANQYQKKSFISSSQEGVVDHNQRNNNNLHPYPEPEELIEDPCNVCQAYYKKSLKPGFGIQKFDENLYGNKDMRKLCISGPCYNTNCPLPSYPRVTNRRKAARWEAEPYVPRFAPGAYNQELDVYGSPVKPYGRHDLFEHLFPEDQKRRRGFVRQNVSSVMPSALNGVQSDPGLVSPNFGKRRIEDNLYGTRILEQYGPELPRAAYRRALSEQDIKSLVQNRNTEIEGERFQPWGKGFGNPDYNEYGDVRGQVRAEHHKGGVHTVITPLPDPVDPTYGILDFDRSRGGAGAPIKTESGKLRTRMPITMKRNDYGEGIIKEANVSRSRPPRTLDDEELQIYDPFSRPGGGAPLRDRYGNILTTTTGNFNDRETYVKRPDPRKKFISNDYGYDSQYEIDSSREMRRREDRDLKYGIAYKPEVREYHSELERMAEYRERRKHLDKRKEQQEARKHANSMDQFWGRPGGGAPRGQDNRKLDLDYTIHSSTRKQSGDETQRSNPDRFYEEYRPSRSEPATGAGHLDFLQKRWNEASPRRDSDNFLKNTSGSSAYNNYEVDPPSRRDTYQANNRNLWNRPTPFATYGSYNS